MPNGLAPKGNGKAIIFSAPSGAGKTTMVKGLMASSTLSLGFSISATTRPPRGDEKEGEAYYYLTQKEFDSRVKKGDFIVIDAAAKYGGYHADMTRTPVVGEASEKHREIYAIVKEAQKLGFLLLKEL